MSNICIPNPGSWFATSRVGTTLLAPASGFGNAAGLSQGVVPAGLLAVDAAGAGRVAPQQAMATRTHQYIDRPGSPPRGLR